MSEAEIKAKIEEILDACENFDHESGHDILNKSEAVELIMKLIKDMTNDDKSLK